MEKIELNLTRKWRSRNFQEIVGQSLAVRILQNSLYLKQYFPVYLFAGQRGCGKTSTARIFASAINCARLAEFQLDPRKVTIPCLLCQSCQAMSTLQHPDFIEIDAASHTGVDNVRNIIDGSSFLPLMSSKKIYLIDEAHMLSKAAFNAFLKILEEPPMSVVFILATTDIHKILETVKSRCFQIFFDPVDLQTISNHLEKLCIAENIQFEESGLTVIAKQSGGSVRDAINLLEQVRFATKKVSKDAVLSVLGYVDESTLLELFQALISCHIQDLLSLFVLLEKHEFSIEYLCSQLIELVYDAILIKHQVQPRQFTDISQVCKNVIMHTSFQKLTSLFELLCSQEQYLAKTTKKLRYFEMMLLQYVDQEKGSQELKKKIETFEHTFETKALVLNRKDQWQVFLKNIQNFDDLVLVTLFTQAKFINFDENSSTVLVSFLKKFIFFQDILEKEKFRWLQILQNVFGLQATLQFNFELQVADQIINNNIAGQVITKTVHQSLPQVSVEEKIIKSSKKMIDISDADAWKLAHALIKCFDGTIIEISGDIYE